MWKPKASHRASERGAALVEMAIILPLLVVLIFGGIEASWAFAQANDVQTCRQGGCSPRRRGLRRCRRHRCRDLRPHRCQHGDGRCDPWRCLGRNGSQAGGGPRASSPCPLPTHRSPGRSISGSAAGHSPRTSTSSSNSPSLGPPNGGHPVDRRVTHAIRDPEGDPAPSTA